MKLSKEQYNKLPVHLKEYFIHTPSNFHPSVKNILLMQYLITLGSRPGDIILDPFIGSGTTAIAARLENRKFIGFEREKEYWDIAQARLAEVMKQSFLWE